MEPAKTDNISIGFTTDNFEETQSLLQGLSIDVASRQEEGGAFSTFH
jgi:hypothetical protein